MKKMKVLLTSVLALMLTISSGAAAFAQPAYVAETNPVVKEETAQAIKLLEGQAVAQSVFENGQLLVKIDKQEVALNISDKTLFIDSQTGLPSEAGSIKAGDKLYVYYSPMMTKSIPPQSAATAIITNVQENKTISKLISINGEFLKLNNEKVYLQNNKIMVPLRTVSKAMNFVLTWDAKEKAASIDNGSVKTVITLGSDSYYKASSKAIGLTQAISLGAKPEIVNGTLYVPAELFNLLYSNDKTVKVSNGVIEFSTK